jgi:hypothetical protein
MILALEVSVGYDSLRGCRMMRPQIVSRTRHRILP